jgi:hypothetical protein
MVLAIIRLIPRYVSEPRRNFPAAGTSGGSPWRGEIEIPAGANQPPGCYSYGRGKSARPVARELEQHGDRNRFNKPVV